MNRGYKNFLSIIGAALFSIFLASFQISFINSSFLNLNLFLILVLYLVLTKNNSKALIFAWLGGILASPSYFSNLGINSLVLLVSAAVLIILYKILFLTLKTEGILFMSFIGVVLYHFLNWLIINTLALFKIGSFEEFGFYFFNYEILIELILTTLLLLIIFKVKTQNV
ncbi:MAG: rod shape-determining protein MreD [Candidatus Azambacteria bacterium]|nr:rod shape-determining protein MreD [Candidatus Azambacteria bacterium]